MTHETVVELIRNRPSLVPELLAGLVDVPAHEQADVESGDSTAMTPTEYRADGVVVLRDDSRPVLAVVAEVQLQADADKRRSWPVYVATLHARWKCPTALLVICVDESVARWCAQPIEVGPGWRGVPLVVGPDEIPVLTDVEQAVEVPELAVLSALVHGGEPEHRGVIDVLGHALSFVEMEHAISYTGMVLASLPEAARIYWEALVSVETHPYQGEYSRRLIERGRTEGRTEGRNEGRNEGQVEATARSVLIALEVRGVAVADADRARIVGCPDLEQLERWHRRAIAARSVSELFD